MSATIATKPPEAPTAALPIASMVMTGIAGAAMVIMMPGMLAALSVSRHLASSETAWLASSEMGGVTAATVIISGWIARLNRRQAALTMLLVLIAAHFVSFAAPSFTVLLAARFVAGVCEGALLGIMSATITTTSFPDRIFAIYLTGNLTMSTILLKLLGHLSATGHTGWLFLVLIGVAVVPILLLPWLPGRVAVVDQATPTAGPVVNLHLGVAGLAGTFILLVGVGATWPLVGALGLERHFSPETIAGILSIATTVGIVSGILVYFLGQRAGRRVPIVFGTLGLGLSILGFMLSGDQFGFTLSACTFMFFWVAILPFYSGVMAILDPSGRLSTLCMAMQFAGLTAGPMVAALMLKIGTAAPFWFSVVCCVPAILLMVVAERGARRA